MAGWKEKLHADPIPWLLEPDEDQPCVRYFTLRDILGLDEVSKDVREARSAIMRTGPVPAILKAQKPEGYWNKPGPGYSPKYVATVWQIIFLAQLGADGSYPAVRAGCEYVFAHTMSGTGGFSTNGTPSAFIHCLAGNLGAAMLDLGLAEDQRLQRALEWQARAITGTGVASLESKGTLERYYAYTPGPLFACGPNGGFPCAWGAVKAVLALGKVPDSLRTDTIKKALEQGTEFLLSQDPATAAYPYRPGTGVSSSWFKFGYPIGYVADVLQNLEALAAVGKARDPRLARALEMVLKKQDDQGRWRMEYSLNGKMWADIEQKGKPSKWITLRALRVLKAAYPE